MRGLIATLGIGALCAGCCFSFDLDFDLPGPPPGPREPVPAEPATPGPRRPSTRRGEVHLGNAEHPLGNPERAVDHAWWMPRAHPSRYRLGYKLAAAQGHAVLRAYRNYARRVRHRKINKDRFRWFPPPGCAHGMHCVYDQLAEQNWASIESITALFRRRMRDAKLNALRTAAIVVAFAQEIRYQIPQDSPFGVLPPAIVVKQKWGDCDSKALLAHMILGSLGIRSIMVSSNAHKHTMLGIALPAPGTSFTWRGTKYAFVEVTAKRAPIGFINPKLTRPNDWRVNVMRFDVMAAHRSASGPKPTPFGLRRERGTLTSGDGGGIRIKR